MAKNYYSDDKTMDWSNSTGQDVKSGDAVAIGNTVGVAHGDIPDGSRGVMHMTGVFVLPKEAAETWPRGTRVYLSAAGLITSDDGGGDNPVAGTAWITNNPGETETRVRLGY